jgi:hypothetical protein
MPKWLCREGNFIWTPNTYVEYQRYACARYSSLGCCFLLTFLPSFDADALPILSAPHQFGFREPVRLTCQGDILVFSNSDWRLRAVGVQDVGRNCNGRCTSQQVAAADWTKSVPFRVWEITGKWNTLHPVMFEMPQITITFQWMPKHQCSLTWNMYCIESKIVNILFFVSWL